MILRRVLKKCVHAAAAISACLVSATAPRAAADRTDEQLVEHEGIRYRVCYAAPQELELHWQDAEGRPYRSFRRLQEALQQQGRSVRFMMNGGIFEPGGIPSGLLVIGGKELRPLNLVDGKGNFFLKPNGVFYVAGEGAAARAGIVTSEEYAQGAARAAAGAGPSLAIQSGPLLMRQGKVHPAFRQQSESRLHRNGVGVDAKGRVVFVITQFNQPRHPNLHEFTMFFQQLGCSDALFLDGDLSMMEVEPKQLVPSGNNFGAIFAITASGEAEPQ